MNQDWHLRWVRIPEGTHISDSKETPGLQRDLLREDGTNRLLGPTESLSADESVLLSEPRLYVTNPRRSSATRELSPAQQAVADAISEVLEVIVREAVIPAVKEIVIPSVKRRLSEISKTFRSRPREVNGRAGSTELAVPIPRPSVDFSEETESAVEESGPIMSATEFRQHLIMALAAEEYATKLKKTLLNVRIEDANLSPELRTVIKLALDGNASLLDGEALAMLVNFLTGTPVGDDAYVLTRNEEPKGPPATDR